MTDWHNDVFEELEWFYAPEEEKTDKYESKNYTKGCRVCGTLTGEHGFSFNTRKAG